MNSKKDSLSVALATVIALGFVPVSQTAHAGDDGTEKCAGIVKATQNDCATSTTACHGSVETDAYPEAWIYLPKGTCEKIVGGHITHQKAPNEEAAVDESLLMKQGHRPPFRRKS